jgi:hypothetical protein
MRALCVILVVPLFALYLGITHSSGTAPDTAVLSLDLRSLGYLPPLAERDVRSLGFLDAPVAFLDSQTLAVSFLVANEQSGPSKRDAPMGSPVLFHTVLLDPLNGRVSQRRSWGNSSNWQLFIPLQDSRFFVQAADSIGVYSRNLQEIASARIRVTGDLYPRFAVSPSGDMLFSFIDSYDAKNGWLTRIGLLDPDHLTSKPWTFTVGHRFETVSNTQVIFAAELQPVTPLHLFVQRIDQPAP